MEVHYITTIFFWSIPVGLPSKEQDQHLVRTTTEAVTLSCGQNWHPVEDLFFSPKPIGPLICFHMDGKVLELMSFQSCTRDLDSGDVIFSGN